MSQYLRLCLEDAQTWLLAGMPTEAHTALRMALSEANRTHNAPVRRHVMRAINAARRIKQSSGQ